MVNTQGTQKRMRRVAAAGFVGTLIEGYDFTIYGFAAALVFPQVFFPALGPAAGLVASLATFGVAFLARPLGGVLFGHFGDRLGRKRTLIATLVLMGVATVMIGLVPSAERIGIVAPILVVALRFFQGISQGGEWAGAMLFVTEHSPKKERGFWAIFPVLGSTLPVSLGSATFLLVGASMSDEAFMSYGWRIPFLASAVLIVVGLYMRISVEETPAFEEVKAQNSAARIPFVDVMRTQLRDVLMASVVGVMVFSLAYLSSTYMTSYGTDVLELSRDFVLFTSVVGGLFFCGGVIVGAYISNSVGRRRFLIAFNAVALVWSLAMFAVVDPGSEVRFAAVVWFTFLLAGSGFGPLGAFLPEQFKARYRYTATGLAYNVAGVLGGGLAPVIAASLISSFGTFSFSVYLAVFALIALVCTALLQEKGDSELSDGEQSDANALEGHGDVVEQR